MVVHGIPGPYELKRGDILSIDVGVIKDGWVADAAMTVPVGPISPEARQLLDVTRASLFAGIEQMRPGNHLGDVSAAIQRTVEIEGLSIIRTLVGHGIGREMHEEPQVPNFGEPGKGPVLEEGTVLAIEPMVNAGGPLVRMGDDGWSVYSEDGSLAAHFEFTVAVTADGPAHPHPLARGRLGRRAGRRRSAYAGCAVGAPHGPRKEGHVASLDAALAVLLLLLAAARRPSRASAGAAAPQPYGTNDAGGFRNVLPPGENGLDTLPQLFAFRGTGAAAAALRRPAAALRKPPLRRPDADRRRRSRTTSRTRPSASRRRSRIDDRTASRA